MITGTGVHDRPESAFTIDWNECSRSTGIGVHDPPERASEETLSAFQQRINAAARGGGADPAAAGPDDGWFLGPRLRDRGSLIADIWEGTAGDLASRHAIAVYPIGGW